MSETYDTNIKISEAEREKLIKELQVLLSKPYDSRTRNERALDECFSCSYPQVSWVGMLHMREA